MIIKTGTATTVCKMNSSIYLLIELSVTASEILITYTSPYGCNSHSVDLIVIGFF